MAGVECRHRRLGAHVELGRRNRPLLLTFPQKDMRLRILTNAKNLKTAGEFSRIYVKKDVHPGVRKEWQRLRDPGAQEKAAALVFLSEILGGGATSFLTEELQFNAQIATFSASFYRPVALDDTTFNIIVAPRPGVSLQEAEEAMDAALEKFMTTGVDPDQLQRIKFQLRADQIYARDDVDRIGNRYGQALTSGLTVEDVKAWPDVLEAVTADDIMSVAREVLDKRASVTGWLMREEVTQ